MEISKSTLILASLIILAIGVFIGNKINKQNENTKYDALRTTYILEMEGFIWDLQDDVVRGRMDSVVGSYYLHNFEVIYNDLIYYPEKYLEWYKDDSDRIH